MNTATQDNRDVVTVCLQHQVIDTASSTPVAQPPRWKQALLTYLVICPMTMVIPQLLAPLFARFPQLGGPITGNLIVNLFVILPVVFYIMPWVTRCCANWLRG
ncbi:hypothetical protein CHR29_26900 [Pseudomonas monteilii]|uniref:Antibiotic biosynthesis monooxygenase n=1 Tax=Pseudomonas monteilii TaxID=76759 RepID=A0AAP7KFQ5_9PSED|nr:MULTISPECIES: hypothetical protein [Pseudomonas]KPM66743.1 hypothetical protein HB4184_02370 [Pseudomonas putida]AYN18598.1 hypothetical protein CHR29_26900 [Pseudomonas monteilii]AYN97703.1 hypothetical protein D8767_01455 [Pseudomonas sp. LTGT-11-2Z]MBA1316557.1 hypothetical protein [Pseudomonas monteilii]MBA6105559.1 hypothetical protein [Pseudomonas monteilii]